MPPVSGYPRNQYSGSSTRYLQQKIGAEQEFILGEKPLKTLRLSEGARNTLLADFQKSPREKTRVNRDWEKWLKGSDPHLSITFESDCATQHPDAMFIYADTPLSETGSNSVKR